MSDKGNNEANRKNIKIAILVSISALALIITISWIFALGKKQNKNNDNDLNSDNALNQLDDITKEPDENTDSVDDLDNITTIPNDKESNKTDNISYDNENFTVINGTGWKLSEGLIAISRTNENKDQVYRFVDINGNTVIPERFSDVSDFSEGLAFVKESLLTGGYIDSKGNYIIPPIFSHGNDFMDGKAIVILNSWYQIIDKEGNYLLNKPYTSINIYRNEYYACSDNDTIDIYNKDLLYINTFPGSVYTINEYNGIKYIFMSDNEDTKIYDLFTGELYFSVDRYVNEYLFEQTGYIKYYNKNNNSYDIHNITLPKNENTLIISIPNRNVEVISKDVFYIYDFENINTPYIIKNGEMREVDYYVISNDSMFDYREVCLWNDYNTRALIDSNGDIVMPYGNYTLHFIKNRMIKHEEDMIYIYDENLQVIKEMSGFKYSYILGDYIFVYSFDGMHVYDEEGNLYYSEPEILTSNDSINQYNNILVAKKGLFNFIILDKRVHDAKIPEYNLTKALLTDAGMLEVNKTVYLKAGNFKKYVDYKYYVLDNSDMILVENDEVYLSLNMLRELLPNIRINTSFWNGTSIVNNCHMLEFNSDNDMVEATFFDFEKNKYVSNEFVIESLSKSLNGIIYISLNKMCGFLGFYMYSDSNLIGISNKPINITDAEAEVINKGFDNYAYNPKEMRRLDASLATQPFLDVLGGRLLGLDIMNYNMDYSNTIPAYEALISKTEAYSVTTDLIFVTEPSEEILKFAEDNKVELEVIPFSKEGFVFLVNADNPIDSLTVSQVRDIYAGKITNWKEVGGLDMEIIPYQRNESSGSQTIMENVFMKGYPLMEPVTEQLIMAMGELIDVVAEYKEDVNGALGYSVYYYATQMYASDQVKVLKINGVNPSDETIRSNDYPVIVNYYIVKRKNDDSEFVKQIVDFVLSDEGQGIVNESGLVSLR